jgi:hypothetical protein
MVEFYSKTKYVSSINGKLRKKLHVEMVKNNKGIHIVGYNDNKKINKNITFLKTNVLSNSYGLSKPCNMNNSVKTNNSVQMNKPIKLKSKKRKNTKKKATAKKKTTK